MPGTLAEPPLSVDAWSRWPNVIGAAVGSERIVGVAAFVPCDSTVTVCVTAL